MTGVEDEADSELADLLEETGDPLDPSRYCLVPTRGVLDEDRDRGVDRLECLPPTLDALLLWPVARHMSAVDDHRQGAHVGRRITGVLEDPSRRDPHPV